MAKPHPTTFSGKLGSRDRIGMRRGEPRRRLELTAGAIQGDKTANVAVLNLSQSGLLLRTDAELTLDEPLMVRLPRGDDHAARVVWSADDLFGCRFLKPLSRADLSAAELRSGHGRRAEGRDSAESSSETFGERIKRERMAAGLTLVELSSLVGVSKPTLWKWESNKIRPRHELLKPLAAALGVGELELVYGAPSALAESGDARAADEDSRSIAQIVSESRRAIAAAAGIEEERVNISLDLGP